MHIFSPADAAAYLQVGLNLIPENLYDGLAVLDIVVGDRLLQLRGHHLQLRVELGVHESDGADVCAQEHKEDDDERSQHTTVRASRTATS